jgi:hypothetical protein
MRTVMESSTTRTRIFGIAYLTSGLISASSLV